MDEAKPREFWVQNPRFNAVDKKKYRDGLDCLLSSPGWVGCGITANADIGSRDGTLVIEKSAFDALAAENARNQDEIARLNVNIRGAMEALDSLRAENQKLREALEGSQTILESHLNGSHFLPESKEIYLLCKADIAEHGECPHTHMINFITEIKKALEAKP